MSQTYGPYSPVKSAGPFHFISGQIGIHGASGTAPEDTAGQCRQALENLAALLSEHGLRMEDIVKTTVFLVDMDDFPLVNEIYMEYFPVPRPARSCVAAAGLPRVAGGTILRIEIEAVAYRADAGREKT